MTRLILRLLNIKDYEVCSSCDTLKQQLAIANASNKELTETLLSLINPKVIHSPSVVVPNPNSNTNIFSKRRAELEKADKIKAETIKNSPFLAKPKTVEELESELGITEEEGKTNANA